MGVPAGVAKILPVAAAVSMLFATAAQAGGDPPDGGTGLWDSVLETLNVKTKPAPTPDFVQATHPDAATLHYIPTGLSHPKRSVPVKSGDDIEATKQALDAARDAQLKPKAPPAAARKPGKPKTTQAAN